jgi:hypothetical protein
VNKQKKIIVAVVIVVSLFGALIAFIIKNAGSELNAEQAEQAKNLCFFYNYDQTNPSTHASLGKAYHVQQWQAFESRHGGTGSNDIDTFCARYK